MLVRDLIVQKLKNAIEQAYKEGLLPLDSTPDIAVEKPQNPQHGDFATSLALRLTRIVRKSPMDIAQQLVKLIPQGEELERVTVAPPGFINFVLSERWLQQQVDTIRRLGPDFARVDAGKGQKVMVEFVSVNPTGPIHHGHTRGAVLGSTLANVLSTAGFNVTREYYVNDAGSQMEVFYRSLYVRYLQVLGKEAELPANGYRGEYLIETAEEIAGEVGDHFLKMPEDEAVRKLGEVGLQKMVELIRSDLARIGVEFDNWFHERTVYESGEYNEAMRILREGGYLAEREGAMWFVSTSQGEDKDNVVVRSNGLPTYFASDIAYHYNKFKKRGFQKVINIWGADHQGHVPRLKAAMVALGLDPASLHIIVAQMVTLRRGKELVKASKRTGEFITLREIVDEVGSDACRYFFLARAADSQMDFDLELAKRQSNENPVYYVQYAHARIAGILHNAREQGLDWSNGDLSLLKDTNELALIRKLILLPELVESIAQTFEPHHLPYYALDLATAFHWFYEQCRVLSSDPHDMPLTLARLKLVEATQTVLGSALWLMGMSAPERM